MKHFTHLKFKEFKEIIPLLTISYIKRELVLVVLPKHLVLVVNLLKNHYGYQYKLLSCISGVDLLTKDYRFNVVYDFLSLVYNSRIRLKVFINEITFIPSIVEVFKNANWWEREAWDLFGIYFDKHPDLRRILTDYGFENYPMRKDFPLSGIVELRYDDDKKRIVSEPVHLSQEFRSFTFELPW